VTNTELDTLLDTYSAGLEAELDLLRQIQELSARQREIAATGQAAALRTVLETRECALSALLDIETQLRPLRDTIAAARDLASRRPGFPAASSLHRVAAAFVREILGNDAETLTALRAADAARRQASKALEAGGATLAAYRRVIAPPRANASLVDERG
jgi:hypothetical protein